MHPTCRWYCFWPPRDQDVCTNSQLVPRNHHPSGTERSCGRVQRLGLIKKLQLNAVNPTAFGPLHQTANMVPKGGTSSGNKTESSNQSNAPRSAVLEFLEREKKGRRPPPCCSNSQGLGARSQHHGFHHTLRSLPYGTKLRACRSDVPFSRCFAKEPTR